MFVLFVRFLFPFLEKGRERVFRVIHPKHIEPNFFRI